MAEDWFYHNSGQTFGPMSAKQLRQHALAGKITRSDHVRIGSEGSWAPATKVKGLFDPPSAPAPVAKPAPAPVAKSAPAPIAKPAPVPVAKPDPVPMAKPAPAPVPKPAIGAVPTVTTEKLINNFDLNDKAQSIRMLNQPQPFTEKQPEANTVLRTCFGFLLLYGLMSFKLGYFPFEGFKGNYYPQKNTINQPHVRDLAAECINRGVAYSNLKKHEEEITEYTNAIAIKANYSLAYTNRAAAYYNLKKYEEALADYNKAIKLDPKLALAYTNRGLAYDNLKKYAEAIADYTKAIELDPKHVFAYYNRGVAYLNLEKYPEAIADFTKAIELDPKNANAYNNRGLAYKALGKTKEANADFAKAKAL